jgi:hypothetical protein
MSVTFIHTADWQVGKPFAGIEDPDKRATVRNQRVAAIQRIGETAQARGAAFVLVAGDLFDSPSPTNASVAAALAAIGGIGLPVLAIPGNHDHGGPGGPWNQNFFTTQREKFAPNLQILLEPQPVELADAVILPCPLVRRHEPDDTSAWLRDPALDLDAFGGKPRIVLAHGSVQGFGGQDDDEDAGGAPNRIDLERLPAGRFDYIALGDWHGVKQINPQAWYAGTPEPDRFPKGADNRPGHILLVTATRGGHPSVEEIATGRLGWHSLDFTFAGDESVAELAARIHELSGGRAGCDLLHLGLAGSLGIAAASRLESLLEATRAALLRLKLADRSTLAPSGDEIEALTRRAADPLVAAVAARLLAECDGYGEDVAVARLALRELHAACQA